MPRGSSAELQPTRVSKFQSIQDAFKRTPHMSQVLKFYWPSVRFSIRTLLLFILLFALIVAGLKWHVQVQIAAVEREKQAVNAIQAAGGVFQFADEAKPILSKTPIWLRKYFTTETYSPARVVHFNRHESKESVDDTLLQLKEHLEALTEPEQINLTNSNLTDRGLKQLAGMQRLREITMARTQITDAGLAHLASLTELEFLELEGTRITGTGLFHLRNLKKMKGLELNEIPLTDHDLSNLREMTNLDYLSLSQTSVTDVGMEYLMNFKKLKHLSLRNNSISNEAVSKVSALTKLKVLSLSKTNINNDAINDILKLKNLMELNIDDTLIDQDGYKLLSQRMPNCVIHWSPRSE